MLVKNLISTAVAIGLIVFLNFGNSAQTKEEIDWSKTNYYAHNRYVIVYNQIFYDNPETNLLNIANLDDEEYRKAEKSPDAERRMSILMLPSQFNKRNLIEVFKLISKRFPTPVRLDINVHTSLATIETPEESEMPDDSLNTRFRKQENKYREAFYIRDAEGENFVYTTQLKPYDEKWAYPFK